MHGKTHNHWQKGLWFTKLGTYMCQQDVVVSVSLLLAHVSLLQWVVQTGWDQTRQLDTSNWCCGYKIVKEILQTRIFFLHPCRLQTGPRHDLHNRIAGPGVTSTVYWCKVSKLKTSRNLFFNENHAFMNFYDYDICNTIYHLHLIYIYDLLEIE